jgi:hypothetical protein
MYLLGYSHLAAAIAWESAQNQSSYVVATDFLLAGGVGSIHTLRVTIETHDELLDVSPTSIHFRQQLNCGRKPNGETRPIAVGEVWVRARLGAMAACPGANDSLPPLQLGVGLCVEH